MTVLAEWRLYEYGADLLERTVCSVLEADVPKSDWPHGHLWVHSDARDDANRSVRLRRCERCRRLEVSVA